MRSACLLAIAGALTASPVLSLAAGEAGADAYLGRWNLRPR